MLLISTKRINRGGWHWTKLENHPPGIACFIRLRPHPRYGSKLKSDTWDWGTMQVVRKG
jgi:hypothetical protein